MSSLGWSLNEGSMNINFPSSDFFFKPPCKALKEKAYFEVAVGTQT
jgi:hypothetical protein